MSNIYLDNREISSFFVSVGTGLMLESLFEPTSARIDDEREIEHIDIAKYGVHYYNVRTIIRNIIASVGNAAAVKGMMNRRTAVDDMVRVVEEELYTISELYTDIDCEPVVYFPDYSKVWKTLPNTINESNYAPKRREHEEFVDKVIRKLKHGGIQMSVHVGDHKLPRTKTYQLVTTHVPYDMLITTKSPNTHLIESHTGKLKTEYELNSKYNKSAGIENKVFPWNERIMNILGDGVVVRGLKHNIKMALYSYALQHKWTTYTTDAKVMEGMKFLEREYGDAYPFVKVKSLF